MTGRYISNAIFAAAMLAAVVTAVKATASETATVIVGTVKSSVLYDVLTYPARVVPKINTTILAENDGIVSHIFAPLGQRVEHGQKLLEMTHTDPVYQYEPEFSLAPVSGVVSSVEVTEGSQVTKGQKLASVTDPSQIRVSVEVPAQDLPMLQQGMRGEFRFSGGDDKISVRVRGVSPFVDPATGTASCELEIVGSKSFLAPGVLGQVLFKANAHKGISIPDYAVIYRGADTMVRLVDGSHSKQVAVKLGRRERGNVEILEGLRPNSRLVLRASRYIADGEAVKVQSQ